MTTHHTDDGRQRSRLARSALLTEARDRTLLLVEPLSEDDLHASTTR